jgi:hypothetical protein
MVSRLSPRERLGAAIGLLGLAEAFAAALLAPDVPALARAGRIALDLVLAAGFVAYLRSDRSTPPRSGFVSRALGIALILAGGVFALLAPGIDPWRRAFRAALALALATALALGVGRALPAGWLRRARLLGWGLMLVELVVALAVTLEVDGPLAVAGLGPPARAATARLDDGGYALPAPLARALVAAAPQALARRNGRVVATARLADTLHLLGDDPVPALARILADPRARAAWRYGRVDTCTLIDVLRPPPGGYRDPAYGRDVAATVRACAAAKAAG